MPTKSYLVILSLGTIMLTAAAPTDVLTGVWGGGRATLTLDATGGTLIEDCQTATLAGPVRPSADGRFVAVARREIHGGGPQVADIPPTLIDIRLTGKLTADRLELDVDMPGVATERLILSPGRRIKAIRCL